MESFDDMVRRLLSETSDPLLLRIRFIAAMQDMVRDMDRILLGHRRDMANNINHLFTRDDLILDDDDFALFATEENLKLLVEFQHYETAAKLLKYKK